MLNSYYTKIWHCHTVAGIFPLLLCVTGLIIAGGCSKETLNGSSPVTPPVVVSTDPNGGLNVRKMAADADSYSITYGALTPTTINTLKSYPLVIVHPYNGNITRDQIRSVQQGMNDGNAGDNVVVLCYISIGEDTRTYQLTDDQIRLDTRFTGDGSGPSIDPRGYAPSGRSLAGIDPRGTATNGGLASYFVNDNSVRCKGAPDKSPDLNGNFLTRFVNAGDPLWYDTVKEMQMNSVTHTPPGLKELLTSTYGRGLACDGIFLDTVDTAAPNKYTNCSDSNHSSSEWTAKGFSDFIGRIRADFPDKVILQNRGLFFFDPREPHYQVSARGLIDIAFFESYRLANDVSYTISPYFTDNKYNTAPKLMAEANRPNGFKVLSLGYASGFNAPKPGIDLQTLLGTSSSGFDILLADIEEAHSVGFRHYLTNANVDFLNSFVKNNENLSDTTPPQWASVFNANFNPPAPMTPRIGIQNVESLTPGSVTVSWDVALDMNRVSYVLYYKTGPFDFSADPKLLSATKVPLKPSPGTGYDLVWNSQNPNLALADVYPYQATIGGLQKGIPYYFVLRAVDSRENEDNNQFVLTATP